MGPRIDIGIWEWEFRMGPEDPCLRIFPCPWGSRVNPPLTWFVIEALNFWLCVTLVPFKKKKGEFFFLFFFGGAGGGVVCFDT